MFYSGAVLASLLVGASAFAPMTGPRRFGANVMQMEADAWNDNYTDNTLQSELGSGVQHWVYYSTK